VSVQPYPPQPARTKEWPLEFLKRIAAGACGGEPKPANDEAATVAPAADAEEPDEKPAKEDSLTEAASDAGSAAFWREVEEQIAAEYTLDKNAKFGTQQMANLTELGWASELADLAHLALKLKKSSGIARKRLQQQRLENFTALKAALDSGVRKDAQQELRNTTSKTLEVACDIQADVKELKGVVHSLAHNVALHTATVSVAAAKQGVIDAKAAEKREGQQRRAEAKAMAKEDKAADKMRRKDKEEEETRAVLARCRKGQSKGNGKDKGLDVD
jgi:hypothetical protein